MNTKPNPNETEIPSARSWVWHCTEDSIAAGQISLLATLETVGAVGAYWWLSYSAGWHWFSMVGLIAAPMLLLRSEESVALGVEMLRRWNDRSAELPAELPEVGYRTEITTELAKQYAKQFTIPLLGGLVSWAMAYWLAQQWLPGLQGWALFWRAGVIGTFAFAVAGGIAFASAGYVSYGVASGVVILGAVVIVKVAAGVIVAAAWGVFANVLVALAWGVFAAGDPGLFTALLFTYGIAFGYLLRALFIRWFASLHHLLCGLKRLPHNWRENLLVIDLTHPPELLPQAGSVHENFCVAGLLRGIGNKPRSGKVTTAIQILAIYLSALAYRWSIKASAWLWWPLVLALTPPFQGLDDYALRKKAAIVSRGTWSKLLLFALPVLLAWLALSLNLGLKEWLHDLSPNIADFADRLLTAFPPPPLGLRFGLLCLALVLAGLLLWLSNDLAASYPEVLDGPKGYDDLNDAQKADFKASARPMERLRLLFIVTLFLLGEAVALAFVHAKNPPEIERLVWPWLLEWL